MVFTVVVESQIQYWLFMSMVHSRYINNKINKLHERSLRIVDEDYESTCDQ